jgi:DNA-binding HxlR family transcriptional regulator
MEYNFEKGKEACNAHHRAMQDTMEILSGKWKLRIVGSLYLSEKRFVELKNHVSGIGAKMLSKELQQLEINGLIKRTVLKTKPITVKYELTNYGHSLKHIVEEMAAWGMQHRKLLKIKTTND